MQVLWVSAGKFHATQVVYVHIREVCVYVVAERVIFLRTGVVGQTVLQIVVVDVAPNDRHLVHAYDFEKILFFACGLGQAECRFNIALQAQALCDAV